MLRRVIGIGTLLVLAGAVYAEFVADIRTPRSALGMRVGVVTHNKLPPESLAATAAAMKAKYGPATEVWQGPAGINAKVDGQVVETAPAHTFFHEALGVTQITGADGKVSTFPFHVSPYELHDSVSPMLVPMLKMRVAIAFEGANLDFDAYDFSIERCRQISPGDLGLKITDRILRLSRSTVCTVVWKQPPVRTMLVGIVVADSPLWIRPFKRSACRVLSKAWLASAQRVNPARQPDYLQCLLVDRPLNQPFGSGVSTVAYEVRKDSALARLEQSSQTIEEYPLRPDPRLPTFKRVQSDTPERSFDRP
jgi:hypothetical protein